MLFQNGFGSVAVGIDRSAARWEHEKLTIVGRGVFQWLVVAVVGVDETIEGCVDNSILYSPNEILRILLSVHRWF